MYILDWFANLSPSLEGLPFAIWAVPGSFFRFTLDIRQFQDHNRHDRFLVSGVVSQPPSYKKPVSFSILPNPTTYVTESVLTGEFDPCLVSNNMVWKLSIFYFALYLMDEPDETEKQAIQASVL